MVRTIRIDCDNRVMPLIVRRGRLRALPPGGGHPVPTYGSAREPTDRLVAAGARVPHTGPVRRDEAEPVAGADQSVWERDRAGWHVAFAVVTALTAALVLGEDAGWPQKGVALALLGALAVAYVTWGRTGISERGSRQGTVYVAIAL